MSTFRFFGRLDPWVYATFLAFGCLATAAGWAQTSPAKDGSTSEATPAEAPQGTPDLDTAVVNDTSTRLLLITLDTTRADHLGAYRQGRASVKVNGHATPTPRTPHLDALATRGTLFEQALTVAPLTLPAHASLLTGLEPPQHGIRDNGLVALPTTIPTLATELAQQGYATAAFVGSRVLDRRFGLGRGFDTYDDAMPAEQLGEYGYPERHGADVVDAALAWLDELENDTEAPEQLFLWLHFYDPHAPYEPPDGARHDDPLAAYGAEITFVDQQIGRLLQALPGAADDWLVAVVGDHGEALGEHGERTHGLLLYRGVLDIPLILAGPGIAAGKRVTAPVSIRQVAPTLLDVLGVPEANDATDATDATGIPRDAPLPGIAGRTDTLEHIYSETWMPSTAYGWSPLVALTESHWRLVVGPKPELFNLQTDPGESTNLLRQERRQARRLRDALDAWNAGHQPIDAAPLDVPADLAASLRSLGYVSGQSSAVATSGEPATTPGEGIDPKDGMAMLDRLREAKELLSYGNFDQALPMLEKLVNQSPGNVPFLSNLARAQLEAGRGDQAVATYQSAVRRSPHLDFLHLQLAEAHRRLDQWSDADKEYRVVVDLNPRQATAWLGLAEGLHRRGDALGELTLLQGAVAAGTHSASIHVRLAQLELARQGSVQARHHLRRATDITPTWPLPWLMLGQSLAAPDGDRDAARQALQKVISLAPRSREAGQARQLLQRF